MEFILKLWCKIHDSCRTYIKVSKLSKFDFDLVYLGIFVNIAKKSYRSKMAIFKETKNGKTATILL